MRFKAPLVDRMPDDVVMDLVAHELAHVYQEAVGIKERFGGIPPEDELEFDADMIASDWGFAPYSIDDWSGEVGLTRVVECKDVVEVMNVVFGPGGRYHSREAP